MKLLFRLFLISTYFILTSTTCDDIEEIDVFMTNDSDETIYVISWAFDDNHLMIPAEVFPVAKTIIKSNERRLVGGGPKEFFETGTAIQLLVYKESTLEKYTEQEIKKYDIYDKRFFLTLEDLEACDFHIYYSDGEDMKK